MGMARTPRKNGFAYILNMVHYNLSRMTIPTRRCALLRYGGKMSIGLNDGTVDQIVKEEVKNRKIEYLKDLEEIADLCGMAAEYISQALQVCVRKTHVLGAEGINDLLHAAEMMNNYANAAGVLQDKIRSGKAKL